MKKKTFLVSALSAFLLVLSACNGGVVDSSSSDSKGDSSTSSSQPTTSSGGGGGGGSSSIAPSSSDEPTSSSQEESSSEEQPSSSQEESSSEEQPSSSQEESSSSESGSSSSEVVTQYTITYAAGEGAGIMNPVVVDAGSEHTLLPCGFTREGYHFDYWQVGNDAAHRAVGDNITVNGDVTVTAKWAQDEPAPVKTLVSIDVANTKTKYTVGDEFDNSALTVTGNYSDETQEAIPANGYTVTGFDSSAAVASQELTVTVKETTISKKITISIVEPTPAFVPGIFVSNDNWETQTKVDLVPGTSAGSYVKENYELHVGESFYVQAAPEKWFHFSDATFGGAYSTSCFVPGVSDNLNVAKAGKYTFLINPDLDTFIIASDYDQEDYVVVGIQGQSPKSLTYNATSGAFTASVSGAAGKQVGVKIGDAEYYNETDKMYLHGKLPAVNNLEYSTDKYLLIHDVTDAKIEVYLGEGGAISVFLETQVEEHYFVVGTIGGADKWSSTDYELIENPGKAGEYYLSELITLKAGDGIKVRNFDPDTWYPDGMGNEKIVSEDGKYQIYFEPAGGHDGWYEGYFNLEKYVPTLYDVTFLKGEEGASGTMEADHVEAGDYKLPVNGFTAPDGKQFKAWLVGDDQYQPGDIITIEGATNVTAVWQLIPVTKYTVTYKANGGEGANVVVENISGSYELAANNFTAPDNMKFKCWLVNDVEKAVGSSIDVEANTEVLAVWENEYTISFAANGGTGSMDQVKQVAGTYHLPANGFTAPEGYKFAGWKIGTDETIRAVGYAYTVSSNATITAQWEALPPSVPEKSIWLGRNDIWSKAADLVDNPSAEGELMALNVELQAGDEFVIRVLGDNYIKTITTGGAKDDFTFDGESNIVVKEGKGGNYNIYVWGENNTKLSIEKVLVNTGIKAYYNATYYDESHSYVFVGDKVTTNGYLVIKYVRDDLSEAEISGEDYGNVKYYIDEACTQEANLDYIFTAEEHNHDMTAYVKLGDFKTSFSFTVIYKNYVHHQSGAEWVDTPLNENMFEHKVALIHLDNADKFAVRTLGTWVSGLEGDYYPNGAYNQDGDLLRNHYSSIWNGSSDVQKVTGIMYDVSWQTTVAGDYVIGVREGDSGVIVYRTNWTVTLKRGANDPVVLVPTATLTREYQFERVELQEGDIITIQRGDIKYGYNYYNGTKSFYECFNKDGAIGNFAGYDGENSWVVKAGCSGIYSFYLKPEMVYYTQSKQFSVTVSPSIYVVKEDLWYYTKGSAEPAEMSYDPYDSSNSVILANIDLVKDDTLSFNDAILSNIGYTNIADAEQQAHFTAGENNKLVVKEGHAGTYTFHIVRSTGAITVDYTSVEAQGDFNKDNKYIVGTADFHTGTSASGASWDDASKAFTMVHDNTGKPDNCDEQYKATIKFNQDDEWKIRTNVYWPYIVENAGALEDNVYMQIVNGNIKVNRTGTYDIYLKTNNDGYWSLYISKPTDFTPDKSSVNIAVGQSADVYVSYATEAAFESLTATPADVEVATATTNIGLKRITIEGVAAGNTTVTISDGKNNVVIDVTVYNTYDVTFDMNISEPKGWEGTSNFSLYVFGTGDYKPYTWDECAGNLNSEGDIGSVTFTIPEGKVITGAVFYFNQVEDEVVNLKKSTDILLDIHSKGTYIVHFVNHWGEFEEDKTIVYKLDQITITEKVLEVNKNAVSVEKDANDTSVVASNAMGELSVISNHPEYATAVIDNKGTVTITGVGVGEAVITVSDGITNRDVAVTVTAPVAKYAVKFEMDLSVVKSWDKTSNFSLYVFGNDEYQPKTWDECANNIDSGSVTFNILEGKDITGAVFYFEQDGELKQSTDMAVTITEAGTYTVNFVNHWGKFIIDEKEVWKLDEMTITQKVLTVNKNSLTIEKAGVDESVVASNWVGPLTATSNQPDVASVTIDAKSGVATITGNGIGDAVITISDGTTNKVVNVTVAAVVEKYTVTYQANGGTGDDVVVNDIFGSYNLKNENPFTAPDGKQFKAWLIGETEYALGSEITVSANTTVKAVWVSSEVTFYFTKPGDWGAPKAYYWKDGESAPVDWPGEAMTWYKENEYHENVYSFVINLSKYNRVIFTDGTKQTVNITIPNESGHNAFYTTGDQDGSGHYEVGSWKE